MRIFLSYARADVAEAQELAAGLAAVGHDVWLDQRLSGGTDWWETILQAIRDAEVFLLAVSRGSLTSVPCGRERDYALELGIPVLPVRIADVPHDYLPASLARWQSVDYFQGNRAEVFRLLGALNALPARKELPDELPEPPAAPYSEFNVLSDLVHADTLTRDQQFDALIRLRSAMEIDRGVEIAREFLEVFRQRADLYASVDRRLRELFPQEIPDKSDLYGDAGPDGSAAPDQAGPDQAGPDYWAAAGERAAADRRVTPDRSAAAGEPAAADLPTSADLSADLPAVNFHSPAGFGTGYPRADVDILNRMLRQNLSVRREVLDGDKSAGGVTVSLTADDVRAIRLPTTRVRTAYAKGMVDDFLARAAKSIAGLDADLERRGLRLTVEQDPDVRRFLSPGG